jgi:hypothetical protein
MKPRLFLLVLAFSLIVTGTVRAADTPPRNLHQVGDHWTPWDPPTSFPEGTEVYIIVPGDTLWDLAARSLGDPYLWPQLWERNPYILDAHWIYPGDPLVMGLEVTTTEIEPGGPLADVGEEGEGAAEDEGEKPPYLTAAEAARDPVPLGAESDIYCTGFIGGLDESFPYSMIGSEYEALAGNLDPTVVTAYKGIYGATTLKVGLDISDIVYLDGGRSAGMSPGQTLTAVLPADKVHHPLTDRVYGRFYRYLGRIRVLSVQPELAIGEIVYACAPIPVGVALEPFEPEPVPLGRRTRVRPVNFPTPAERLRDAPVILSGDRGQFSMGEDSLVYIDRGEESELVPGDIYTIYRMHRPGLPPVVLGELAVLSVRDRSAVGRILNSRFTVYAGDRLELK